MPRVLIAEDSPTQAAWLDGLLRERQYETLVAADGVEALAALGEHTVDVVLTDLVMPRMDGLALVEEMRRRNLGVPVVLVTERGSEETAAEALQRGAVSYIPKRRLGQDLFPTLRRLLGIRETPHRTRALLDAWVRTESEFLLGNDPEVFPDLIAYVRDVLELQRFGDEVEVMQVAVALSEALDNALYHGNLELDSRRRDEGTWAEEAERRRQLPPYRSRRILVQARLSPQEVVFAVKDEGRGFDPSVVPDPRDPANLGRLSGRGLLLIATFMDEVRYGDGGREIRMRRAAPPR